MLRFSLIPMKRLCLLSFILLGALDLQAFAQKPSPSPADPVIGRWRCQGENRVVELHADGTAVDGAGHSGLWKPLPSKTKEREYQVNWSDGTSVDTLTLSADGKGLGGMNVTKSKTGGDRIEASADDPVVGRWRWFWTGGGPVVVEFRADGTEQGTTYPGMWKSVPSDNAERKYEINEGNGINYDDFVLSADGKKFTGITRSSKIKFWANLIEQPPLIDTNY
jgi:hypothetical protein